MIIWIYHTSIGPHSSNCNCLKCSSTLCSCIFFLEFHYARGLQQLVTVLTRLDHTLDVVFCNDYNCVLNIRPLEPSGTGDNCQVWFQIILTSETDRHAFKIHNFKFADWEKSKSTLLALTFTKCFTAIYPSPPFLTSFTKLLKPVLSFMSQRRSRYCQINHILSNIHRT